MFQPIVLQVYIDLPFCTIACDQKWSNMISDLMWLVEITFFHVCMGIKFYFNFRTFAQMLVAYLYRKHLASRSSAADLQFCKVFKVLTIDFQQDLANNLYICHAIFVKVLINLNGEKKIIQYTKRGLKRGSFSISVSRLH